MPELGEGNAPVLVCEDCFFALQCLTPRNGPPASAGALFGKHHGGGATKRGGGSDAEGEKESLRACAEEQEREDTAGTEAALRTDPWMPRISRGQKMAEQKGNKGQEEDDRKESTSCRGGCVLL